jgi:hypothetical protein
MAFPINPVEGDTYTENNTVWIYSAVAGQWNRSIISQVNETTYIGSDGAPGGIGGNTQVIFNDNGSLASDAGLVFNKTTDALTITGPVIHPLGAAATPSLTFTGDPNTGIYSPGADQVAISTNGTGRLFVDASGNVGVGTGSPATALQVVGVGTFGNNVGGRLQVTTDSNLGYIDSLNNTSTQWQPLIERATEIQFHTNTAGVTPTQKAVIDSSGRLGLGTSSPGALFEANGGNIRMVDTNGRVYLQNGNTSGGARIGVRGASATANGYLAFETNDIEFARFDSSGRLGIGTTSPGSLLHLADAGDITVGTTTGTKIGTATTQKLGFYNATPVVQPAAVADATDAATVITQLNDLLAKLRTLGLIAT